MASKAAGKKLRFVSDVANTVNTMIDGTLAYTQGLALSNSQGHGLLIQGKSSPSYRTPQNDDTFVNAASGNVHERRGHIHVY